MREGWFDDPGWRVIHRSFAIAAETSERARPVHLLGAIAELDSPVGSLLCGASEAPHERVTDPPVIAGGGGSYLLSQTQQIATQFAGEDPLRAEHLLVAVIDQADGKALAAFVRAGLDAETVRAAALGLIGLSTRLPRLAIPPLAPAGTRDRPALPVEELDPRAWRVLTWRREHLPLDRVCRVDDWHALSSLERGAARRVADCLDLDDDQRYSLYARHHEAVAALTYSAHPELVDTFERSRGNADETGWVYGPRSRWERLAPRLMMGWPTWFANRRVGLRDRQFRLRTWRSYRGQPTPGS